jgi:hypothetical protein
VAKAVTDLEHALRETLAVADLERELIRTGDLADADDQRDLLAADPVWHAITARIAAAHAERDRADAEARRLKRLRLAVRRLESRIGTAERHASNLYRADAIERWREKIEALRIERASKAAELEDAK